MLGPKIKQHKKTSSSTLTQTEVQVHMMGKNIQHMNTENDAVHWNSQAKSFFIPDTFVLNIINNSVAAIDTQITKPFLQPNLYEIIPIIIKPKSLQNQIYTETNASNSRAQGLDLGRKISMHNFILLAKD